MQKHQIHHPGGVLKRKKILSSTVKTRNIEQEKPGRNNDEGMDGQVDVLSIDSFCIAI